MRSLQLFPSFFLSVTLAGAVAAETAVEAEIEEIVVTADFRDRPLADVPSSVTVLDSGTIEEAAVEHFEELTQLVPNLNYSGEGNRAQFFQIRGIGERSQYEGAPNPSVGFLVDGIDFSGIGGIALTWDVEQVEVLRGPQGTRYGANALAGLINVRSVAPRPVWEAKLRAQAGGDDLAGVAAAVGGPLADDLAFRLAAERTESDGFRDNAYLGVDDTNDREESLLRGRLRWTPGDAWRVDLTGLYVDVNDGYDAFAIDNGFTTYSDEPGSDAQRSLAGSLALAWEGSDAVVFESLTSVARSDVTFAFDADWGNPEFWAPFTYDFVSDFSRDRQTISQELRIYSGPDGRLFGGNTDWLAGVYLLDLRESNRELSEGIYIDPAFGPFTLDKRLSSDYSALSSAAFGQLDHALGERGTLSLGLRLEHRDADYEDVLNGLPHNDLDDSETMLGGELSYRHQLARAQTAFASLSRGYKAGGFNLGTVPDESQRRFDAESLWSLEFGLRSQWLDGRLGSNLAVFYSRREDQQIETSRQIDPGDPSSFVFFTANAAEGRSVGLEAELDYAATERLTLYANLGFIDAEFHDYERPDGATLDGRDQAHAPTYTFAVGGTWRHPRGWFARLDATGKDEFFFSNSHDQRSGAYELVHARAGFQGERFGVSVWGRNLFDRRYAVRGFFFGNEPPNFPDTLYVRLGDPRQLGVTVDYRFE